MQFAIIDIETTGNQPKDLKVIEIAMVLHNGTEETGRFHSLVNPDEAISPFITRLTGIRNSDVSGAPKFFEIAKKLVELTEGCVFVAHNVGFDYGVIRNEFNRLGFDYRRNHLDTIQAAKVLYPGHTSYGLKNITKTLGINLGKHHRATDDTRATAELFSMLYALDPNRLERFIRREIDPKVLHPKLDISDYDEVPNKTGIYRFFDESGEHLYTGKSIRLKTRISEHLKNNKTAKGVELRQRIAKISHELTGSELIALLIESAEIKEKRPFYNRSQKTSSFPYGLYTYRDQQDYVRFQVKKRNLTEIPVSTFKSLKAGKSFVRHRVTEHGLCEKLCGIQETSGPCFQFSIHQCKGACCGQEKTEMYNQRVGELISRLNFSGQTFLVLDKGRNNREYSFVFVKAGECRGFGFAPRHAIKRSAENYVEYVQEIENNMDYQTILRYQLEKNPKLTVIPLSV